MPTSAIGDATNAGALTQALAGNRKLGQEQFLKLLVTQMTNQDPLSPQDDKAFLAEMAQFSSVESLTQMSSSFGQLQAAALLGKTVDASMATDSGAVLVSGTVSSVAFAADGARLQIGDKQVNLADVILVR